MILKQIKERIALSKPTKEIISHLTSKNSDTLPILGAAGSLKSFIVSAIHEQLSLPILCVLSDVKEANSFSSDLQQLYPNFPVALFEHIGKSARFELGAPPNIIGKRLEAVQTLLLQANAIVVCTANSIWEKIPRPEVVKKSRIMIEKNQELIFNDFIQELLDQGFTREYMVDQPGEMSVRGGIVDVFPFISDNPIRIEFLGDVIESIREFDVLNQRTQKKLDRVEILGPFAASYDFLTHQETGQLDGYGSILDYLAPSGLVVLFNSVQIEQALDSYQQKMSGFKKIIFDPLVETRRWKTVVNFNAQSRKKLFGNFKLLRSEIEQDFKLGDKDKTFLSAFFCESDYQRKKIEAVFEEEGLQFPQLNVSTLGISEGFRFPLESLSIYTSHEFYGRPTVARTKPQRYIVSRKRELSLRKGDFVVHVDHGIGCFKGLEKISVWGAERECLKIEYRNNDHLYVPLEKMDKVQKYSSKEGFLPTLSKLGGTDWERLKKRTKRRVKDIAQELIRLYAQRKAKKGFAFSADTIWQNELEASFVYEETPDQLTALQDIKRDMEKERPMDRLVCGDVGYGKTEVALRAAFKAVSDGKQVAILVPTTILAQQHYNTFKDRLEKFPVNIEMLSRFRNPKQQQEIIAATREGKVDVLIGTHRVLSKDVTFKNLGLLIVDEEQKFGVIHKERLKFLSSTVDVLTLTATPIPRTLHLALMGGRDMSIISTPPEHRHPIKTEIAYFDKQLIREVILGEVARGGQVFFVHNRVQSISLIATMLRELIPEVSFGVAHGQMKEKELERVVMDFIDKKFQCLISTMIIESGMDIPNVNTLIVNRADRFGLSQLYQLRGRVGRSHLQAYAYFLIPSLKKVSREAIKRLQTIQEFTHLGAGYNIAMRDLEIRGAGNLLGSEQSGFIDALGFDLYCKIVEDAVRELQKEKLHKRPEKPTKHMESIVTIDCDAHLPEWYIDNEGEQVDIYRRLVEAKNLLTVEDIREELRDRFGKTPIEVDNLLNYISLKLIVEDLDIERLQIKGDELEGKFYTSMLPKTEQFRKWMGKMMTKTQHPFKFIQKDKDLWFKTKFNVHDKVLCEAKKFLQSWQ